MSTSDQEEMLNGDGVEDVEDDEEDLSPELCPCLFCEARQSSVMATLNHCRTEHGVDLLSIAAKLVEFLTALTECDFYSCVKLVNYIRKESPPPSSLLPLPLPPYPWDEDSYLHPVLEWDPLLQVDWETAAENSVQGSSSANGSVSGENDANTTAKRLCESERRAEEYQAALVQSLANLQDMRLAMRRLVEDDVSGHPPNKTTATHTERDGDGEGEEEEEEEYFSTYSHFSIHHEMLSDRVRTGAYQTFISKNTALFKDKVVLDVGCGTGILALFAAQAGAKLVIGVDQSCMLYNAMEVIRENGYEDRITLIRGKMEEVQLPVDKVDVIISEWMGYFLLFESMLDTVIFARDKWLKDTSQVYPNVCSMKVVAMGDRSEREARVDFWDNVYGFKMGCMKREILKEASVQYLETTSVISSTFTLKEIDVSRVTVSELEFEGPFHLTIHQDTDCHAIVGFFEAGFVGPQHIEFLRTGPQDAPTHWKQTVFYLQDPIPVHTGDVLEGTLAVARSKHDQRALNISLSFTLSSPSSPSQLVTDTHKYSHNYILR